ncbi:hypothetical protein AQUCO_02700258v1 [Aquilegia coerulea]|uniref:PsbP C-terminal domain-containing protein n=1 Tax=Aquilegia coerulea TaxID=218851 RepID=A0A2G5D5Z5_AQUCA|nr:hypothetical protein AQUCO_02700258v1 [Aquilegia coerulea]
MVILQSSCSFHPALFLHSSSSSSQLGLQKPSSFVCSKRNVSFCVKSEHSSASAPQDKPGRRQALAVGTVLTWVSFINPTSASFAAESKKGFLPVTDQKDGYEFLYPFGWQEVSIEGQDKVFKDVIEPLETVSVNLVPTSKQDIRDLGSPQEVAEVLIKKVLAPASQKTKLVEAKEHEVDGKIYYTFEFLAKAPNYTRHGLSAIAIGNGMILINSILCSKLVLELEIYA